MTDKASRIAELVVKNQKALLDDGVREQLAAVTARKDLMSEADLRSESSEFMALFAAGCGSGELADINTPAWKPACEFLGNLSRSRTSRGFTPAQTATYVFSLKQPLFARLQEAHGADTVALAEDLWATTAILDKLGLYTIETAVQSREDIIRRQQIEMLELSTPVVKVWEGILALPLIGTLDSARTQVVMESLLQSIVDTGSGIAIIDITGVPTVDTLVAQHLLKTVAAAKLMGAECFISGIRPQIAQTMVHLGVVMGGVQTTASLSDALALAFRQRGLAVTAARS